MMSLCNRIRCRRSRSVGCSSLIILTCAVLMLTGCANLPDMEPTEPVQRDLLEIRAVVTTVFITRHAEPDYSRACDLNDCEPAPGNYCPQDPCLSTAGKARAKELRHALRKAAIQAIFSTAAHRTRETAQPLADAIGVPVHLYNGPSDLAATIMSSYRGQRILVVSHSGMVESIIVKLHGGPNDCKIGEEFDNLCAVVHAPDRTRTVNLQYGKPTDY